MKKNSELDMLQVTKPAVWSTKPSVSGGCFRAVLIWFPVLSLFWAGLVYGTMRWIF